MSNAANEAFEMDYENSDLEYEADENSKKFLTFCSDGLYYAIDADFVSEIIMGYSITRLPKLPSYISGIINLRGQIIPIMDIRLRMGRTNTEFTFETCIIVMDVNGIFLGVLVDSVSQMVDISEADISSPPVSKHQDLVEGMARIHDTVHLIINIEELIKK